MIPTVKFLGFLSLLASIQGLSSQYSNGLKLLEEVDQLNEEHANGLELLIGEGKKKLLEQHDLERRRSLARSGQFTENVLNEAVQRNCPLAFKEQIANVQYTLNDRWTECMNLSEKILDFERISFDLYKDYIKWRPQICQSANDILACEERSIFTEVQCFYSQMSNAITKLKDMEKEVVIAVEKVQELVRKSILDFKGCFSSNEDNVRREQDELLETLCPLKSGRFRR